MISRLRNKGPMWVDTWHNYLFIQFPIHNWQMDNGGFKTTDISLALLQWIMYNLFRFLWNKKSWHANNNSTTSFDAYPIRPLVKVGSQLYLRLLVLHKMKEIGSPHDVSPFSDVMKSWLFSTNNIINQSIFLIFYVYVDDYVTVYNRSVERCRYKMKTRLN